MRLQKFCFYQFVLQDVTVKSQKLRFLTKIFLCNFVKLFGFYFLKFVNFHPKRVFAGTSLQSQNKRLII